MKRPDPRTLNVALKVGVFVFLALFGEMLFGWFLWQLMEPRIVAVAPLAVFASAAAANALALRIWDRGGLVAIGLGWTRASVINLALGLGAGLVCALAATVVPVLEGAAEFTRGSSGEWSRAILVMVILVFGAIGEEMLFHGYGFQVLMAALGPFATILPVSVLFTLAHAGNLNVSPMAMLNTGLWGVVLGYAFFKSGDLWLPIGLHLGWNWVLPLFGANLSGFTINVTGYTMRWRAGSELWTGGAYGPEASVLTSAVLVILFLWLLMKAPVRRQTPYLLRDQWEEFTSPEEPAKE